MEEVCPCGCGLVVPEGDAERERGVRRDAEGRPRRALPAKELPAVVLITGAPGAGKSTVARILARCFDRAAHIDIDWVLHHLTVSGKVPPQEENAEAGRQMWLALRNTAAIAANYLDEGFVPVIEGAVADRKSLELLRKELAPRTLLVAMLAPPAQVCAQRDRHRGGKQVAHLFGRLHEQISSELSDADIRIDSSGQDPATTATLLLSLLLRRSGLDG